jgi:hypothetical protein
LLDCDFLTIITYSFTNFYQIIIFFRSRPDDAPRSRKSTAGIG